MITVLWFNGYKEIPMWRQVIILWSYNNNNNIICKRVCMPTNIHLLQNAIKMPSHTSFDNKVHFFFLHLLLRH